MDSPRVILPLAGRAIEVTERCENCQHFGSGDEAARRFHDLKKVTHAYVLAEMMVARYRAQKARKEELLVETRLTPHRRDLRVALAGAKRALLPLEVPYREALAYVERARGEGAPELNQGELDLYRILAHGQAGFCRAGKSDTDFVAAGYRCAHWSNPHVHFDGPQATAEEAREIVEGAPPPDVGRALDAMKDRLR